MINFLNKYFPVLPIIYLALATFVVRSDVKYVYLSAIILVVLTAVAQRGKKLKPETILARWMIVLAAIGLSSAVILSIEKIELLEKPDYITSCSLNPVVSCSPVIASDQASAFAMPNPYFGIFGFAAVLTAGMTILAGATRLHKLWWHTLLSGILFGVGFSVWLFVQGVFNIGKLCLYCMLVWLVSFGLLWFVTAFCIENKYINFGKKVNKVLLHKYELITVTYTIIFMLIIYRWLDYWLSLF
jgi:uncharacterized membrane protein